jgi:hypothetical protein
MTEWKHRDWEQRLVAEFETKGLLTYNDVVRVCGQIFHRDAWAMVRQAGFKVEKTDKKEIIDDRRGPHFYRLIEKPQWMQEHVEISKEERVC